MSRSGGLQSSNNTMPEVDVYARIIKLFKRVVNIPKRIRSKTNDYRNKSKSIRSKRIWLKRYRQLNRIPGVFLDKDIAFLSETAKIDFESSGFNTGGEVHLSSGNRISDGVILAPWDGVIRLDENVFIGPYCVLYGHGGITVGKDSFIAGHTFIVASDHTFNDLTVPIHWQPMTKIGVTIGEDVWIGCGARILDGVSIGDHCVVGAGAVVTKSLPPFSVSVGVPARVVGYRDGKA